MSFVIVWSPTTWVLPDVTFLPHVGDGEVGGDLVSAHRGRRSLCQMFRPRSKQKQKVAFFKKFLPRSKLKGYLTSAHLGTSYSPALASVCKNMVLKKSTPRHRQDKHTKIFVLKPDNTFATSFRGRLAQLLRRRCTAARFKMEDFQSCSFLKNAKMWHKFINSSSGIHDTPFYLIFEPGSRSGTSCDR